MHINSATSQMIVIWEPLYACGFPVWPLSAAVQVKLSHTSSSPSRLCSATAQRQSAHLSFKAVLFYARTRSPSDAVPPSSSLISPPAVAACSRILGWNFTANGHQCGPHPRLRAVPLFRACERASMQCTIQGIPSGLGQEMELF